GVVHGGHVGREVAEPLARGRDHRQGGHGRVPRTGSGEDTSGRLATCAPTGVANRCGVAPSPTLSRRGSRLQADVSSGGGGNRTRARFQSPVERVLGATRPKGGGPSTRAAPAVTARTARTPASGRSSPSLRSRRSAPRIPIPGRTPASRPTVHRPSGS